MSLDLGPGAIHVHDSGCAAVAFDRPYSPELCTCGATRRPCPIDMLKDTNPKDAVGVKKAPLSTVSAPVLFELGTAMLEGARKYGRHNYRVASVRASVYYDAALRHLAAWWEGEDVDPDSGLSHIAKALAGLVVLRDSMIQGNWVDDRPPPAPEGWLVGLNARAGAVVEKYPDPKPPHTARGLKNAP